MLTKARVMAVLKKCYDPEIPINIVDMGLIYGVQVKGKEVLVKITLTNPCCPMASMIKGQVEQRIRELGGRPKVELVFDPPWSPERMSAMAKKKLKIK